MEYYVYELFDQTGQIVDVGMTGRDLNKRLCEHTKRKPHPNNGHGRWYGRNDLDIRIFSTHSIRKEALKAEGARKLELGMEWTERLVVIQNGKIRTLNKQHQSHASKAAAAKIKICPYCIKEFNGTSYNRWHGDRCKLRPISES
jgi:predicted GIY-YIG superfamily endonuclease